jgi:hypothetical protein
MLSVGKMLKMRSHHAKLSFEVSPLSQDGVDTSLLLEDLKRRFRRMSAPVDVSFRQMVSWVRPGDQFTHLVHPYPAKLLPHIAHFFASASALRRSGECVLDPFAGTGTVALEVSLAGGTPLVADSNPLALLIAKVKTTPYDTDTLVESARQLSKRIARLRTAPSVPVVNDHLWYLPDIKKSLERVLRAVMELDDPELRDFFRVCFSVVVRRLSLADPSISVPVRLRTKTGLPAKANAQIREHLKWLKVASVTAEFDQVVQANIGRVVITNRAFSQRARAVPVGHDARMLTAVDGSPLASGSVPLTITSPPYGSAQKYIRASSLALNWLGLCAPEELANLEAKSIGREHLPARHRRGAPQLSPLGTSALPAEVLDAIRLRNPHRAAVTETYVSELANALTEVARVTTAGGHVAIIVGNNTVAGIPVNNDEVVRNIMQELGLALELELHDRIHSRGLLTARHSTAGLISGETILLFRK